MQDTHRKRVVQVLAWLLRRPDEVVFLGADEIGHRPRGTGALRKLRCGEVN